LAFTNAFQGDLEYLPMLMMSNNAELLSLKALWINETEITEIPVFLREDKKLSIVTES
jgi:hypothetical protein